MRRLSIVSLCLLGTCGGGALAASTASAALPELGRCVSSPGTGGFKGTTAHCIAPSPTHTGNWEWLPGPGASPGFKTIMSGVELVTVTKSKITCNDIQLTGEYTGPKTEKVTNVLMQGCFDVGPRFSCYTNPLEPGTIESENPLVGELGFIPGSKTALPWVGWDLKSENPLMPIVSFTCGEGGGVLLIKLEGSVIGHVKKTDLMVSEFGITYKQSEGKQIPSAFTGGEEDVLTEVTQPTGPGTKSEQVGLAGNEVVTNAEPLEIKEK